MKTLWKDILAQTKYIPQAFLLVLLFVLYVVFWQNNNARKKWGLKTLCKQWRMGLFLFYAALILMSTVLSRRGINPCQYVFKHFGFRKDPGWNNEIIENILLFIPYTFFYILAFRPKESWKAALALSVCTTVFIELSQLLFWLGHFQFSDMLHNAIGGMIGCGIWYGAEVIKRKLRQTTCKLQSWNNLYLRPRKNRD